ncbi:MAG TPA: hypothetical protein DEB46_02025 [Myxococcales bacterium]|nr:hypothetical protein [Myxococcales bacterium]
MDRWLESVCGLAMTIFFRSLLVWSILSAACMVPSQFDGNWRTNLADENFEAPDGCGDGQLNEAAGEYCDDGNLTDGDGCNRRCHIEADPPVPPQPLCGNGIKEDGEECDDGNDTDGDGCDQDCRSDDPVTPDGCGNGELEDGEECDGAGATPLCDDNCRLIRCNDQPGDAFCEGIDNEAVCVFLRDDEDGKHVCLRRGENDSNFPDEIEDRFFQFCGMDGAQRPEQTHRCNEDSHCQEDRGESCRVYLPETWPQGDRLKGLCWVDGDFDSPPMIPGWWVEIPGSEDPAECVPMSCADEEAFYVAFVRDAFAGVPISSYCADQVTDTVIGETNERTGANGDVLVLTECTINNLDASPSCVVTSALSGATCNVDGFCQAPENEGLCRDLGLPYECMNACRDDRCRNCQGQDCEGCGGEVFGLCERDPNRRELNCMTCNSDAECGNSDYRCFPRRSGEPGRCQLACTHTNNPCPGREMGQCSIRSGDDFGFCSFGDDHNHQPNSCNADDQCPNHLRCDENERLCVGRPCNNAADCLGARCDQERGQCAPDGSGGGTGEGPQPAMIENCNDDQGEQCGEGFRCDIWWTEEGPVGGVCLPDECDINTRPCPLGYVCDGGECAHANGDNRCDPRGHGQNCGPAVGMWQCLQIPEHAGGTLCTTPPHNGEPRCTSDDDCSDGFACLGVSGECIAYGDACNNEPQHERYDHFCRQRYQSLDPQRCTPGNGDNCANEGQTCQTAVDYLGQEEDDNNGVCAGQACGRHYECPLGQACFVDNDGNNGRCKQHLSCQFEIAGETCGAGEACVPRDRFGLHGPDYCVTNTACRSSNDCQDRHLYCANSRCAGDLNPDHCGGEIGGTVYPNLCVPTRPENVENDQPNEVYADQVYRNLAHGDQFSDSLGMSDQDVYKFEFQGDASISTTITVTPTQAQQGDIWFPVTCYLMEPDHREVLDFQEVYHEGRCEVEVNLSPATNYQFVVFRRDVFDNWTFGYEVQISEP